MQLANTGNIRNQIISPVQKKQAEQNQKPVSASTRSPKGNAVVLTEDVVAFSADAVTQSSKNKNPSVPVSIEEKDALLRPAPGEASISVYA